MHADTQGGYLSGMSEDFNRMADVKLLVEDQSVPAHKTVLAASSDVFAELFAGLPKSDSKLPLQEESLADVHLTLTYLYSDFSFGAPSQAIRSVEDAKRLTKFAYKYAMKQMSQMCEEYLISQVSEGKYGFRKQRARDEEPLVSLTCLAEDCGLPKLLAHCEHALVEQADHGLWHSDEVISGQISRRSLLEILRSHQTYNCCCANVSEMLAWQDHDSCAKEDQK